jgi:hypothetical protein
MHTG